VGSGRVRRAAGALVRRDGEAGRVLWLGRFAAVGASSRTRAWRPSGKVRNFCATTSARTHHQAIWVRCCSPTIRSGLLPQNVLHTILRHRALSGSPTECIPLTLQRQHKCPERREREPQVSLRCLVAPGVRVAISIGLARQRWCLLKKSRMRLVASMLWVSYPT
jgi:hypothetical protein